MINNFEFLSKCIITNGFKPFESTKTTMKILPANEFIARFKVCKESLNSISSADPVKIAQGTYDPSSFLTKLGYTLGDNGKVDKNKTAISEIVLSEGGWTEQNITKLMKDGAALHPTVVKLNSLDDKLKKLSTVKVDNEGEKIAKIDIAASKSNVKQFRSTLKIVISETILCCKQLDVLGSKTIKIK